MRTAVLSCGGVLLCRLLLIPMVLSIAVGLAHVLTAIGRRALWIVLHKAFTFVRLCLGIWYDSDVDAFAIHKKVFEFSGVWTNPNVLMRIREAGLDGYYDRARHNEEATVPFDDVNRLPPCLQQRALEEQLRQDYSMTLYSLVAMRAALLQAMPYMSLLSIFASFVSGHPQIVFSETLKTNLLRDWVLNAEAEAREIIQQRIDQEGRIRTDETHEHAHCIANPDVDKDGVAVPPAKRQMIEEHNEQWQKRMRIVLCGKDRVNEWEVYLLTAKIATSGSNRISFAMGVFRFFVTVWLLFADSSTHSALISTSLIVFTPYVLVTVGFPVLTRMGVSMYVTDAEVMFALCWIIIPARTLWRAARNALVLCFDSLRRKVVAVSDNGVSGGEGDNGNSGPKVTNTDANSQATKDIEMADVCTSSPEPALNPILTVNDRVVFPVPCDTIPDSIPLSTEEADIARNNHQVVNKEKTRQNQSHQPHIVEPPPHSTSNSSCGRGATGGRGGRGSRPESLSLEMTEMNPLPATQKCVLPGPDADAG